jgi:hypothetical protein
VQAGSRKRRNTQVVGPIMVRGRRRMVRLVGFYFKSNPATLSTINSKEIVHA